MHSRHGTLTGSSTVDVITVTGLARSVSHLAVSLPNNDGEAWFTVATSGQTAATPAVGANDTFRLAVAHPVWSVPVGSTTSFEVRIVSTTAVAYSVHAH